MSISKRTKDSPVSLSRQLGPANRRMYRQKPSSAVYLLDMKEISELWGWAYGTTVGRVYAAANTGRIHAFQRPGHQRFYLSDELEAVFGPPKIDAASKPAWWGWSELSDEDAEIAS